jgi:hypothetical protein
MPRRFLTLVAARRIEAAELLPVVFFRLIRGLGRLEIAVWLLVGFVQRGHFFDFADMSLFRHGDAFLLSLGKARINIAPAAEMSLHSLKSVVQAAARRGKENDLGQRGYRDRWGLPEQITALSAQCTSTSGHSRASSGDCRTSLRHDQAMDALPQRNPNPRLCLVSDYIRRKAPLKPSRRPPPFARNNHGSYLIVSRPGSLKPCLSGWLAFR